MIKKIKDKIKELESDERLSYPMVKFETNYILASIQISLKSQIEILKELLEGKDELVNNLHDDFDKKYGGRI